MRSYSSPNFCKAELQRSLGPFRGEKHIHKLFREALDAFNTRLGLHAFRFFIYDLLCVPKSHVHARQNRLLTCVANRYSVLVIFTLSRENVTCVLVVFSVSSYKCNILCTTNVEHN